MEKTQGLMRNSALVERLLDELGDVQLVDNTYKEGVQAWDEIKAAVLRFASSHLSQQQPLSGHKAREIVQGMSGMQARVALLSILQGEDPIAAIEIAKTWERV